MSDADRAAELRALTRYALGLGCDQLTVLIIYEAVCDDVAIAQADRAAEVRRRLLKAAMTG